MKKLHNFTVFLAKLFAHFMYLTCCVVLFGLASAVILYAVFFVTSLVRGDYIWTYFVPTLVGCSLTLGLVVFIMTEVRILVFKED